MALGLFAVLVWGRAPGADLAGSVVELRDGAMLLRVSAITEDVLRVRVAPEGSLSEEGSWAVLAGTAESRVLVEAWANAGAAGFRTKRLSVRMERSPLRLIVSDLQGHVLLEDAKDRPVQTADGAFTLRKVMPASEHYFGLGDKTGPLDHRGQAFTNWNTDAYRFQESTDPLYKCIPFFVAAGGAAGSYGILLDNTWRSWFDFGKRDAQVLEFGSSGGPIDYYLLFGPSTKEVVKRYADLTGMPPLTPLWALGFQQSRYSYMSAAEVREIAHRLRAERLPADVIWMDIDYQDRYRPFTTNPRTFGDLPGLARELRQDGLRLVAITDLHIAMAPSQGYLPYDTGAAGDHFVKRPDGSVYVGVVWPGAAVFPEFTQSRTRAWWGSLYREFVTSGIAGFWNDMNEPSIFESPTKTMPLDIQHRIAEPGFKARSAAHEEIHNVYGMQNARATFEGLTQLSPQERPFVMTRASFAGGQRYGATWTGDNSSTWNHLKMSIPMLLNLGMSGFAYSGADVGGFVGAPSPELMTRWIEIAAFTPIFRAHSANDSPRKEPWLDGPRHTAIRRHFIETRYQLMPYIYALADENARTGAPLMRPLFYEFPDSLDAPSTCDQATTFLLGDRLLIAPPADFESLDAYRVCLPAGGWYDYWTGELVTSPAPAANAAARGSKNQILRLTPALDRLPVFVRAGAILPRQPLVQSTAESPQGPLALDVYPGDDCRGVIYLDDGHSVAYRDQSYLRQTLHCAVTADGLVITFDAREGTYRPWFDRITMSIHHWQGRARALLDGKAIPVSMVDKSGVVRVTIGDQPGAARLSIDHASDR